MRRTKKWTTEEVRLVQSELPIAEVAKKLGRTLDACDHARRRYRGLDPSVFESQPDKPGEPASKKADVKVDVDLPAPEFGFLSLDMTDNGEWVTIGLVGDTHLCCREERLAELHNQYDLFEREGIKQVFHAGNIVDGYIPKINGGSVFSTTIDGQCQYCIDNYPRRKGVVTNFITGDDHEGWWQKEGFNFGAYLQFLAVQQGRDDLKYIGHVESDVELKLGEHPTILKVQHPGGGSAYARSYSGQKQVECVPLDSEILTRTGWKTYDKVVIGEEVLGYDERTGRNAWTPLLRVNVGRGAVTRFYNDQFEVVCTPNHRWVQEVEQRAGANPNSRNPAPYSRRYRETAPLGHTARRARIIQSAKSPDGPGFAISGYDDLLRRAAAPDRVLLMTSAQRVAFIEGMLVGEGTRAVVEGARHQQVVFSQNKGPVLDAFRLACALEGITTNERPRPGGSFKPDSVQHCAVTLSTKQTRIVNRLRREDLGEADVWCPTTGLGTWVMRQGRLITITGNSFEGGEKPAILVQGHYHVSNYMNDRNIHVISLPGFQDQTIFARKKRLRMEIGGSIASFKVDPATGAVTRCRVEFNRYFTRGYYKPYMTSDRTVIKGHITLKRAAL